MLVMPLPQLTDKVHPTFLILFSKEQCITIYQNHALSTDTVVHHWDYNVHETKNVENDNSDFIANVFIKICNKFLNLFASQNYVILAPKTLLFYI